MEIAGVQRTAVARLVHVDRHLPTTVPGLLGILQLGI